MKIKTKTLALFFTFLMLYTAFSWQDIIFNKDVYINLLFNIFLVAIVISIWEFTDNKTKKQKKESEENIKSLPLKFKILIKIIPVFLISLIYFVIYGLVSTVTVKGYFLNIITCVLILNAFNYFNLSENKKDEPKE